MQRGQRRPPRVPPSKREMKAVFKLMLAFAAGGIAGLICATFGLTAFAVVIVVIGFTAMVRSVMR